MFTVQEGEEGLSVGEALSRSVMNAVQPIMPDGKPVSLCQVAQVEVSSFHRVHTGAAKRNHIGQIHFSGFT